MASALAGLCGAQTSRPQSHLCSQAALEEATDARDGVASVVGAVSERARQQLRESLARLAGAPVAAERRTP